MDNNLGTGPSTAKSTKMKTIKSRGKSRKLRGVMVLAMTLATSQMKMSSTIEIKSTITGRGRVQEALSVAL